MHLDAIRVEAHYSALLAERSNMIVSLVGQIEELQARIADLEQQVAQAKDGTPDTVAQLDSDTTRKRQDRPKPTAQEAS
jgi:cell division protein FtsB